MHPRSQVPQHRRVPLLQLAMDEKYSIQCVAPIYSQEIAANLPVEHVIVSLAHGPALPDARCRLHVDRMHVSEPSTLDNLLRFKDARFSPALQAHDGLNSLLLCKRDQFTRLLRITPKRPFDVCVLAGVHGRLGQAIVRIHPCRHDDEINVLVCHKLLRRRIRTGGLR